MAKHRIEVNGLKVYSNHGCLEEEGRIGGHYVVDVSVLTDFSKAFSSDNLEDTVCYVDISKIVYEEMSNRNKLIEKVGYQIIKRIKEELNGVLLCTIKVTKVAPPIPGEIDHVAIIIEE